VAPTWTPTAERVDTPQPIRRPPWTQDVPFDAAVLGAVRRAAVVALRERGVTADLDLFEVVLGELLANAVTHGEAPVRLLVDADEERIRVEVRDASGQLPRRLPADLGRATGNGLRIVAALSHAWGVEPAPAGAGKQVWFEVRLATGAF
jgi:hypothetical protein